jgi:hypothetical protein
VVAVQALAVAHGLPQLATTTPSISGPQAGQLTGLAPGSAAGAVLAAYVRLVAEVAAQVADWQRACDRYAADVSASLGELRTVLAELAGTGTDEDGA